jgi:copper resistance protein C
MRFLRLQGLVVGLALVVFVLADAAGAHARVIGTFPSAGAVVDAPPARVTVFLAAKPATIEGDPLRVYAPTGSRIDDGAVTASEIDHVHTAVSVGLRGSSGSSGSYHVAYRVISRDSHLVAGRFSFQVGQRPGTRDVLGVAGVSPPAPERSTYARPTEDVWPKAVAAAGVLLGALGLLTRPLRRSRRTWAD